ncbi:MupG family TIM beta-alpha barrel fold protein [Clostridium sp. E02]|uniref:MupG family TIM beta-alpha barrel fold protein n=1 Tax=Clostridium sp. E02 TaxID=2487134 RepID=UPI000F524AE1|nr:MupG family TIM beta-alpha barrel fold protein [Clostridium sp. E02]
MINTGISFYFSNDMVINEKVIKKAIHNEVKYIFTSLHIPEESSINDPNHIKKILKLCKEGNLNLIVDVGPETLEKLEIKTIEDLQEFGITHVRLDYGFSANEIIRISQKLHVVLNASTITEDQLLEWSRCGADFTKFSACHNYYPKPYTGLSIQRVKEINQQLKSLGFTTMAFVPGNKTLRSPLFQGLPTVEAHRWCKNNVLLNMLELFYEGSNDVVLIGDPELDDISWHHMKNLSLNYVELKADIRTPYEFVRNIIHHDRLDSSQYVIRSQESRTYKMEDFKEIKYPVTERKPGSIFISNHLFLRYCGELEIARISLPKEERVIIIGQIEKSDLKYLPYIKNGLGVKLI